MGTPRPGRRWVGRSATEMTARVLARDGYRCVWCGGPADTADHVIPKSKGGAVWDLSNLVAACRTCNSSRGNHRAAPRDFQPKPSRVW